MDALLSTDSSVRSRAEQEFSQSLTNDPSATCVMLCNAVNGSSDSHRALGLVLVRQVVQKHWGNLNPEARQQVKASLFNFMAASPREQDRRQAVHAAAALPGNELGPGAVQSALEMLGSPSSCRVGLLFLDKMAEFSFDATVGNFEPIVTERVLQVLDAKQNPDVGTRLAAVQTACSLVLGAEQLTDDDESDAGEDEASQATGKYSQLGGALPVVALLAVAEGLTNGLEQEAEGALQSLANLCEKKSWCFDRDIAQSCSMLLEIAEKTDLTLASRALAMTVLGCVLQRRGVAAGQDEAFSTRVFRAVMLSAASDTDFYEEWDDSVAPASLTDALDIQRGGPRGSALVALAQFCMANESGRAQTTKKFLERLLSTVIKPALGSQDWKERHAGFSALAVTFYPLEKVYKPYLADICAGVSQSIESDPHPRVRVAAAAALIELLSACENILGPVTREKHHALIVPALLRAVSVATETQQSVALRCVLLWTLESFADPGDCPEEAIAPYVDVMVQVLVGRVLAAQANNALATPVPVMVKALDALSAVAETCGQAFTPYYDTLMPSLKAVVAGQDTDSELARAATSCVAAVAESAGKDRFMADAQEIVGGVLARLAAKRGLAKDETNELESLFSFSSRVASVLGHAFEPFLNVVAPSLTQAASADLGLSVTEELTPANSNSTETEIESDEATGQHTAVASRRGLQNTLRVSANVYAFQVRRAALETMDSICDALGSRLSLEALESFDACIRLNLTERSCTCEVNAQAAEAAGSLFRAACERVMEAAKVSEEAKAAELSIARRVLVDLGSQLLTGLAESSGEDSSMNSRMSNNDSSRRVAYAEAFERMMRLCFTTGKHVTCPPELVPKMVQVVVSALVASTDRRKRSTKELKSMGFEPGALEEMMDQFLAEERDLCSDLVDALGYMIKTDPHNVFPAYKQFVLAFHAPFLSSNKKNDRGVIHNALCVFVDAVEFGDQPDQVAEVATGILLPALAQRLTARDALICQASAYGFGVCADALPPGPWLEDAAKALIEVIEKRSKNKPSLAQIDGDDDDMNEDDYEATALENLVSSLGRIAVRADYNTAFLATWLERLPVTQDEVEAQRCNKLLCDLLLRGHPVLSSKPAWTRALHILAGAVAKWAAHERVKAERVANQRPEDDDDDDIALLDDETARLAVPKALAALRQSVGEAEFRQALEGLGRTNPDAAQIAGEISGGVQGAN